MNRKLIFTVTALFLVLVPITTIFAGTHRNVSKDITCTVGGACDNGAGVQVKGTGGPSGGCSPTKVGYIGWDLTNETRTWQSASLKLTSYYVDSPGPFTFELHPANTDSWTGVTSADPGYNPNVVLATATDDLTDNVVEFASDALGQHFLARKGGEATLAVILTGGCGNIDTTIAFEDHEGTGGSAPQSANEPDLIFYAGPVVNGTPTAVEMKSIQTENNNTPFSPNWPVIAGLFVLAAVVVAGVGYGVRRSKQS